ncbi:hypothetical protein ACIRP3_36590 [Streptomyces sp. NPDC101209]|uniref:hypothetical protein n=1 Tax=Streptomyces sp. NPDC101209 TaxID=3366129 RepID=UPI003822F756
MTTSTTPPATGASPAAAPAPLSLADVRGLVDETVRLLTVRLLTGPDAFPDVADRLAVLLRRRLAEGAYDVESAEELGRLVTADVRSLCGDRLQDLVHHPGGPRLSVPHVTIEE